MSRLKPKIKQKLDRMFKCGELCSKCQHQQLIKKKGDGKLYLLSVYSECKFNYKNLEYNKDTRKASCINYKGE